VDSQIRSFFSLMSIHLSEGRVQAMARSHRAPLPVSLADDRSWHVLHRRGDIASVFAAKYAGVQAAGIGRLRACVTGHSDLGQSRCVASVVWFYIDNDARRAGRTTARYFLSKANEGLGVDMIEFEDIAFPQLRGWFTDNAVSDLTGGRLKQHASIPTRFID